MSFENSIDWLVYHSGSSPKCHGSRVHETWYIEQGKPLKRDFPKLADQPVDNWDQWLTDADATPRASLRVLVVRTEPVATVRNDMALVKNAEKLKELFERAKLPIAGLAAYLKNQAQYACIPPAAAASPGTCSFFFSDPSVGWTWSYCPDTRSTRAILLCRETMMNLNDRQEECRGILGRHVEFVDQPLLLSYLCTELMGSRACVLIGDEMIPEVLQIERSTGLETWNPGREEVLPKLEDKSGVLDNLGVILYSQRVTDIRFRLTALLAYIPTVRRQNQRHAEFLRAQPAAQYPDLEESLARTLRLDEIMEYFDDYLKVRLLKAESLANRIAAQVVAVEKLQALKMSKESQVIAEDSHLLAKESTRDSKGMMTIAAVTMVFLPGTFVSALFAMPIFQWDASNTERIVNPRIWVYWAVTVPLTLFVLGLWTLYRCLVHNKEKTEDEEVAKTLRARLSVSYRGKQ